MSLELGLHAAAAEGRINDLKRILTPLSVSDRRQYLSHPNIHGFTPLHAAIFHDHPDTISLLLEMGADPNTPTCNAHFTLPLHLAALRGGRRTVRLLIDAGADGELLDGEGWSALSVAQSTGNKVAISLLKMPLVVKKKKMLPKDFTIFTNDHGNDDWWRVSNTTDHTSDHFSDGGTPAPFFAELMSNKSEFSYIIANHSSDNLTTVL